MKNVIGYVAAFFTTFSLLPQIVRIWKLREARDVSLFLPFMASIGSALWLVYGVMIGETPIIAANIVSLLFALITLFVTIKYK